MNSAALVGLMKTDTQSSFLSILCGVLLVSLQTMLNAVTPLLAITSANSGVIVFVTASILKDAVNRIGDLGDDGQPNQSFKG